MTLIIQVALGIVLGVTLLMYADALLGLGMVLLFIVAGLGALALAWYLVVNQLVAVTVVGGSIAVVVAVLATVERINPARGRYLKKRIRERKALGYDATPERTELDALLKKKAAPPKPTAMMPMLPAGGTPEKERVRRRLLGYDD